MDERKQFVLIGAAGFVAPRHMRAIKDVGGELVAAFDPHDSVGVLDSYFPECRYFSEFERFDRFVQKILSGGGAIDSAAICSPNYLHDAHCRWAMRIGADAICEKPIVLHERNLDELKRVEEETGRRVYAILQLRHHPAVVRFREQMDDHMHICRIKYHTPRGRWYAHTWKGDERKSGGLVTNIGIHLFDLCGHLFGGVWSMHMTDCSADRVSGAMEFNEGGVRFDLSIAGGIDRVRRFEIDGQALDLSVWFEQLHSESYRDIIRGQGWGIEDARPAIRIVEQLREKIERERLFGLVTSARPAEVCAAK